jgi:hypothetical protein
VSSTTDARSDPKNHSARRSSVRGPDMRRVLHRETRSTRAAAAIVAAVLVILVAGYGLLEAAVHAIGQPPWLIEPQVAAQRITELPAGISPLLLGVIGAVVALPGIFFLVQAIAPGRRARHALAGSSRDGAGPVVVVDDEVVASSLARRARLAANVTPGQVMVVVSQREVLVNVRPTSGIPLDGDAVLGAVEDELAQMALDPAPVARVNVAPSGVVGA